MLRPDFPVTWLDELRAVAADDIDGDGALELVAVSTQTLDVGDQRDVVMAYEANGQPVTGFPPNTTGASGCDDFCYVAGGFGQTLALGDLDGAGGADLVVTYDESYASDAKQCWAP
nr:hypothetical protein [Myxococcota bacterium]